MEDKQHERYLLMRKFDMKFLEDFKASLENFNDEEVVEICSALIRVVKRIQGKEGFEAIYETEIYPLLLKYKNRLLEFSRCQLTDYFFQNSLKLPQFIHANKFEDKNQTLTDKEFEEFMVMALALFANHRHYTLLLMKPQEELSGTKEPQQEEQKNIEFTARRRALFLHYLDKKFKINGTGDKKPLNEIAHFLTGNNIDNLYKHLRNPLGIPKEEKSNKSEQVLKKDLEYVRRLFERLDQPEIIQMIEKDIQSI